jgi:hypothetical protein
VPKRKTAEEIIEKCNKVRSLQTRSAELPLKEEQRKWLQKFFQTHAIICVEMKNEKKRRVRSFDQLKATSDFIRLETFKNFVIDSNINEL